MKFCVCFKLIMAIMTIVVNGYCILSVVFLSELRSMEYGLIVIQSVVDLIFTGLVFLLVYSLELRADFDKFCYNALGGWLEYANKEYFDLLEYFIII